MNGTEELVRLLRINTDFAHITGNDPYLAAQIRDAVDASLGEVPETNEDAFQDAYERLAGTFGRSAQAGSFAWIDARHDPSVNGLLWLRAAVMARLRSLARHANGTLLVANLTEVFRPPGKRWSPARRQAYADTVQWMRELVRARSLPHRPIRLLLV
jgi:hypothetical protein